VCYAFGRPLEVEEVDLAPPGPGEVRVRLAAAAVCHSDVHLVRGEWGGGERLPVVPGHEGAGTVEAVGEGVTLARPGETVVVSLLRSCGRCFYCTTGAPYLCDAPWPGDAPGRLRNARGDSLRPGFATATFAEETVVHESQVVPLPAGVPLDGAALLACAVVTGVGAVVNTAAVAPGSSVVVLGCGGVGLNAVQGARLAGASPIIAADVRAGKLPVARRFGATDTLDAGDPEAAGAVLALTGGRGADYVFVTAGQASAVDQALQLVRPAGTVVVTGMPPRDSTVPLSVFGLVATGRRVLGSVMGSTRLRVDVPRLVALYQQGRLLLDELISARYPLEGINEAIESLERGGALRNVIALSAPAGPTGASDRG
jgi:Zn-dependent alcohol dehydrogenase